jgi:hypothetical protein
MTEFKDGVISITTTTFSFLDTLKILFGWSLYLRTETGTEHKPGKTRNDKTEILLIRPRWLQRKHSGCIEDPEKDSE